MRLITFSSRCRKEILRDPLNIAFGLGFPIVLLLLLSAIQANIPISLFEIESLAPGIAVFGLSFTTLFSATLVSRDRESSLLQRLYTTPLRPIDYILGYMLPIIPIAVLQGATCYLVAIFLGLPVSQNILFAIIAMIPVILFYISLGLLFGSILNVKQVGGICGALLTNLSAWFSGIWFDITLVGNTFKKIADALPFLHAVEAGRSAMNGDIQDAAHHLIPVLIYTVIIGFLATVFFLRQMKRQ